MNTNLNNPCFLDEHEDFWELRICGYTFQYVHSRKSGWYNNHAYVEKKQYDTTYCKKISAKEAVLMLLDALYKGAQFNTESQREKWELAAAMLTK